MLFSRVKTHDLFLCDTTQKEVVRFLNKRYHKPQKYFLDFIRNAREKFYIWDDMQINQDYITIMLKSNGDFSTLVISKNKPR